MTARQLIEDRIRAECSFKEVGGVADLDSVLKGRVSAPGCYLYAAQTRAARNEHDAIVAQWVNEVYAAVIVTRNVGNDRGDGSDENEAFRDQVSAALLGWEPQPGMAMITYNGGRLVSVKNGYLYWQELYSTGRIRRS